jgi:hypothetical protein
MIEQQQYRVIPTDLELNGPILSFTTQPVGVTTSHLGSATFTGIGTATFPTQDPANPALNSGSISYRWYEVGVGALSDGTNITGTATTTLTLSNLQSPTDNGRQFYLGLDYIPGGDTPNAINEIFNSNTVTLNILPFITINTQPVSSEIGTNSDTTFLVTASLSDTSFGVLSYQWQLNQSNLVDSATVSGSLTPTLTISRDVVGVSSIRVLVSNTSSETVVSDEVSLDVVEPRSLIKLEGYGTTSTATLLDRNLDQSEFSITSDTLNSDDICFYSSEKDLEVELDLFGAKGSNKGSFVGGEGGYSRIQFTMKKEEEYVLRGIKSNSALFLYRKGSLIAVVGQGGGAGNVGNGGKGGGVNLAGSVGSGAGAGSGGNRVSIGGLLENGTYGSASSLPLSSIYPQDQKATGTTGGQTIKCSKGVYWINQGLSSCQDIGVSKFRLSDGTEVTNSASITRGFKAGYTINRTAGASANTNSGVGGDGATGGNGGGASQGGGGGGSGYSDGSISIINTQLGGSTGNARVNVRLSAGDFFVDSVGRILILSVATSEKDPRTLTKVTGKVLPGTDTCIDDIRWQNFLNLATNTSDGNYRLAVTLNESNKASVNVTENNLYKLKIANRLPLRNSLTDWLVWDVASNNSNHPGDLLLAWDETEGFTGTGLDYSGLYWNAPNSGYTPGFAYYGGISRSPNPPFTSSNYHFATANWWILPPGVPDFS